MIEHHHPMLAGYMSTVLGYSVVILICLWFFIHFLRVGLKSHDSVHVDTAKSAFAPNEKSAHSHGLH